MIGNIRNQVLVAAVAVVTAVAAARPAAAVCVGDCEVSGQVAVNEIVRCVNIFLETAQLSSCQNCDQNGDGQVEVNEVLASVNSFLDASTCPQVAGAATPTAAPATPTAVAPTATAVAPTATPAPPTATAAAPTATAVPPTATAVAPTVTPVPPTATRTLPPSTPTPTATQPVGPAVCGNGVVEGDEQCDDGGTCIGGTNAGIACHAETDCTGQGVCLGGTKIETVCDSNADCPGSVCIHCKPFGGDGCAANCTNEVLVQNVLKPGVSAKGCVQGPDDGKTCTASTDCQKPGTCGTIIADGTSGAMVQTGLFAIPLPLTGTQTFAIGKQRNGQVTGVIKSDTVSFPRISVGALACACVRGVTAKSCGGTVFEKDGSFTTDCTPYWTDGDTLCTGKKPCTFVHGPGNSSTAVWGCDQLTPVDLNFSQDAGGSSPPFPPPPTPPPGFKPPVIVLSGTGGAGSAVFVNTSAIGTANGKCDSAAVTDPAVSGPDKLYCTDDDPRASRGTPNTLPQVTGTATGVITNTTASATKQIGPLSYHGGPYSCAQLTAPTPSMQGGSIVGAFTALNQPAIGDDVVRNRFVAGP